ncbi:MAG: anthranilate phosphoribosyltransferase [Myxococcota bacterium]|nr:anthranilate phosphoribosyltransferase [Myxococcota bacterium]
MIDEHTLRSFGAHITRLIQKQSLTREQAKDCWHQVLADIQPELQQGAFIAALAGKGEDVEEIAGSYDAILELDTNKIEFDDPDALVENCGTGMDALKTFNISTAASIVAAAAGVTMAKHGARGITSRCGTVDVAEQLGVDVECDVATVKQSIEQAGIGLFNGMSQQVHPRALFRILSQIRFGSTLNIAGSLAHPARPKRALRGVFAPQMVEKTARVMRTIGMTRAFVVFGWNGDKTAGIDELSTMGETEIAELKADGQVDLFTAAPEDFGLQRVGFAPLAAPAHPEEAAALVQQVIAGQAETAKEDIVCLNAAPLLVLAEKAQDFAQGLTLARQAIASGQAQETLERWVANQRRHTLQDERHVTNATQTPD